MAQTFKPPAGTKAPATHRIYDVCVIGSQLGGAVAGALLARRGYRVLHIDHDGVRASYEDGGYLLPYGPAILLSPRILPAAELVLTELGLATDATRTLEAAKPDLQMLLPRHRVDLGHEPARRQAEFRREWPQDADRLEAGLADVGRLFESSSPFLRSMPPLPPAGLFDRRAVSKALKWAGAGPGASAVSIEQVRPFDGLEDHGLISALRIAQRFLSHLDGEPSSFATTRLVGALLRGSYRLPTGQQGLRDMIRRRIGESRGEILGAEGPTGAIAERLEVSGGKVHSVRLEGSTNSWVARVFLMATDAPAVARMLPPEEAGQKLATTLERVEPRRQLLAVNLVVKTAALPPALGDTVLVLRDPGGADAVDNATLLQILPARRDRGKGAAEVVPNEKVVCAAGFVPANARDGGDAHLSALGAQIREAVADAIPFFERHLVRESVPAVAAPREPRGSRLLAHPLYAVHDEQTLGVTGLPCRSPYKNLIFAGREVVPGLGLEGEFHAGYQAAAAAEELLGKVGKKDVFR